MGLEFPGKLALVGMLEPWGQTCGALCIFPFLGWHPLNPDVQATANQCQGHILAKERKEGGAR